jgi:hypothetical protein
LILEAGFLHTKTAIEVLNYKYERFMKTIKILFVVIIVKFLITIPVAQQLTEGFFVSPSAGGELFYWGEFSETEGEGEIVREEGFLYNFGVACGLKPGEQSGFAADASAKIFWGLVDYSGFLQDSRGNIENYVSRTGYIGSELRLSSGYQYFPVDFFALLPFVGFGYKYWKRDLDNGGIYGYDEFYQVVSADLSLQANLFLSKKFALFMGFRTEVPFYVSETIDLASRGQGGPVEINLVPGANPGFFGETGLNLYNFDFSIYVHTITFSKSNVDQGFHQPESQRIVMGMKGGVSF